MRRPMRAMTRSVRCFALALSLGLAALATSGWPGKLHAAGAPSAPASARPAQGREAAVAAFLALAEVLRHPRCLNCHSSGDFPRQGDDGHPHAMSIRRGAEGRGVTAQKCSACHQDHNLEGKGMPPGAPGWRLPPPQTPMIWQGRTDAQICAQLKSRRQNGNRSIDEIVAHLRHDPLVLWGWHPGEGRSPVAVAHAAAVASAEQWAAGGAPCPRESRSLWSRPAGAPLPR
jgi:hypothetical protein